MLVDLLADDLVDRAKVLFDIGDLFGDASHEVGVGGIGGGIRVGKEVEYLRFLGLAVSVDPPNPLLET
jgi:hypothetical protein